MSSVSVNPAFVPSSAYKLEHSRFASTLFFFCISGTGYEKACCGDEEAGCCGDEEAGDEE
jgi:hypothetical protein